jgi:DNA-damage-inducible protein D
MGIEVMTKKAEISIAGQSFERLKKANEHGAEYWSARDLQPLLGYSQWRRFEQALERAITLVNNQEIRQATILPAPARWSI